MRNILIDKLKGFAIILVVIGHLIQQSITDFDDNLLFKIIYSFHMPLFFFLSGYVFFISKTITVNVLAKRANALLVPFLSWSIINYFFDSSHGNLVKYLLYVIYHPDAGLWYLYILFFCYLIFFLLKRVPLKLQNSLIISTFCLMGLSAILKDNIFGIKILGKEFPFFVLGYYCHQYDSRFERFCMKYFFVNVILFFVGAYFWTRNGVLLFSKADMLAKCFFIGYSIVVAVAGVNTFYYIFSLVKNHSINSILSYIGKNSLAIYAIHFLLLQFVNLTRVGDFVFYLQLPIYAIAIISVCLTLEYIISKNKLLASALLGKKFEKFKFAKI